MLGIVLGTEDTGRIPCPHAAYMLVTEDSKQDNDICKLYYEGYKQ